MNTLLENCGKIGDRIQRLKCFTQCLDEVYEKNLEKEYDFSYLSPLVKSISNQCKMLSKDYSKIEDIIFMYFQSKTV